MLEGEWFVICTSFPFENKGVVQLFESIAYVESRKRLNYRSTAVVLLHNAFFCLLSNLLHSSLRFITSSPKSAYFFPLLYMPYMVHIFLPNKRWYLLVTFAFTTKHA